MEATLFTPLSPEERATLEDALMLNANGKGGLEMNPCDTSFVGICDVDDNDEVIRAIKEVPCHY